MAIFIFLSLIFFAFGDLLQDPAIPLQVNTEVHGKVTLNRWAYYRFTVPAHKGFTLLIEHATGSTRMHDIDVYVRKGELPDRNTYDYKDTSILANITLDGVAENVDTMYIVGIFGFRGATTPFTIILMYSNGCPQNCSGHGVCRGDICSCFSGFSGEFCQYNALPIRLEETYTVTSLPSFAWAFYSVELFVANTLTVNVHQLTGDVDLYVRYEAVPDFLNFAYVDFTIATDFNLTIVEPLLGTWYLGFYGFGVTGFSFSVSELRSCPMKCSLHGTCLGSYCRCDNDFVGLTCEESLNYLSLDASYHGYVDENFWNFYKFIGSSDLSFVVNITHLSNANCDIYALANAKPTKFMYSYRNISTVTPSTLVIEHPGFDTWWIGIYGITACEYDISLQYQGSPSVCGNCVHGQCVANECKCDAGWVGQACDAFPTVLQNGVKSTDYSITNGEWKYFEIDITESSQLNIVLQEVVTYGLVWVFVTKEGNPTLTNNEANDVNSILPTHRISMQFSSTKTQKYIIGVYGTPFIVQQDVKFNIDAYYPPF